MTQHPHPCLNCGQLTTGPSRCPQCQTNHETKRANQREPRPHYGNEYQKLARQIRDNAEYCWICGGTARAGDPWQADHVIPRDPASPLAPAHRSCNIRRANQARTRARTPGGVDRGVG
jgi:hypothetical protein